MEERKMDSEKMRKARESLKEIFGDDVGVVWNTHFTEDIRPYLVKDRMVFIFDNIFGSQVKEIIIE